jgi:hypothetical protein
MRKNAGCISCGARGKIVQVINREIGQRLKKEVEIY